MLNPWRISRSFFAAGLLGCELKSASHLFVVYWLRVLVFVHADYQLTFCQFLSLLTVLQAIAFQITSDIPNS